MRKRNFWLIASHWIFCLVVNQMTFLVYIECSSHFGSYGRSFGPYNILLVTDRSIYCHMTLSAMNYLLFTILKSRSICNIIFSIWILVKFWYSISTRGNTIILGQRIFM
jgi:hypothetical protein